MDKRENLYTVQSEPRLRWDGLDTLRGADLVSMMLYHAAWDLVYVFGIPWAWYGSYGAYLWQQSICWTFLLLSGYCFHLGHRRLRRGLLVSGGGVLVDELNFKQTVVRLLADAAQLNNMNEKARKTALSFQGATDKIMDVVKNYE